MIPQANTSRAGRRPLWARLFAVLIIAFALAMPATSFAQGKKRKRRGGKKAPAAAKAPAKATGKAKKAKPKDLDFTGMDLTGRLRTPQLLYFLERASAELEAASLERRSFVPEMVRSLDEEAL